MITYDDPAWVDSATECFNQWWGFYLRKQEDKTELAKSIALDAWLACRHSADDELC